MKLKRHWKLFRGLAAVFCFIFIIMLGVTWIAKDNEGSVSQFFGVTSSSSSGEQTSDNAVYGTAYSSDGVPTKDSLKAMVAAADDYVIQVQEDGSVLLKNDDVGGSSALPLSKSSNVTLLGQAWKSPVYRGTSNGASFDMTRGINPINAMKSVFNVNEEIATAYGSGGDGLVLTETQKSTFTNYNDAAIVMLSRLDGEGSDVDVASRELALSDDEKTLLETAKNGGFKKIIVLLNSGYPMEVDWFDDYNVDACLYIGYPGVTGFQGVANILAGDANPSGRIVDTYATDSQSSAAMQNFGDFQYSNSSEKYLIYAEGIYVGYKYYETRYEDCVLDRFNATNSNGMYASTGDTWSYSDEVVYPFGYGLSYTTFSYALAEEPEYDASTDLFTIKVKVTNTGDVAGKTAVQVYAQSPYTEYDMENLVEKSAIQLAGFGKTDTIQAGESETVTVTIDRYLLASYDVNARNGEGGYILDAGDYYLSVGDNAHDALNNVLAAKGATGMCDCDGKAVDGNADLTYKFTIDTLDEESYRYTDSGAEVSNKFTDDELFSSDYNYYNPDSITYLTRQDWTTFPKSYTGLTTTEDMMYVFNGEFYDDIKPDNVSAKGSVTTGEYGDETIKFYQMNGVPLSGEYTDDDGNVLDGADTWNTFLNQLTLTEMATLMAENFGTSAIESVVIPGFLNQDGPDGIRGTYTLDKTMNATLFNNVSLLAGTFDMELYYERGLFTGEDGIYTGVSQYWGIGFNNHRTPYGGRNFEYPSEDSIVSYYMSIEVTLGCTEKGLACAPKHLCANDQETNRSGVMTFMTEQTLREVSLRSFEGAYTVAKTQSTMTSYNAIGACFSARNNALMNELVRGEWGYEGMFITDAGSCTDTPLLDIACGTDMFCLSSSSLATAIVTEVNAQTDGYGEEVLRNGAQHILYVYANSNAVNGLEEATVVTNVTPWWLASLYGIDAAVGVIAVAGLVLFGCAGYLKKEGTEVNE